MRLFSLNESDEERRKRQRATNNNWIWAEAMNRRDFLKFMGKAAGAAAGAPLDKLNLGAMGQLASNKFTTLALHVRFPGLWGNDGGLKGGNLTGDLAELGRTLEIFKKLTDATDIRVRDLNPYGSFHFLAQVPGDVSQYAQKWNLQNLPEDHEERESIEAREDWPHMTGAYHTKEDFFKNTTFGILKASSKSIRLENGMDLPANDFTEAVQSFVEHSFDNYNMQFMPPKYFDQEGLNTLENYGIDSKELAERNRIENDSFERDQEDMKRRSEERMRRMRDDGYAGREVGYERENQFDPRSSRPVQAIGPLEGRLRELLK